MAPALSGFLDLARWIAALAVLLGHANVLISLTDIMVAPHGPAVYAWWFVTAFARQAVLVFFVISGFLIGGKALTLLRRPQPFLGDYFIDRFSRIYIVLVPVLGLTFLIDAMGRRLFAGSGVYELRWFDGAFEPERALGALLQLQNIWVGQAGTNGALWSLACEFWYYILFPLMLLPFSRAYSGGVRLAGFACGLCLAIALSLPSGHFSFNFLIWALGAAVARAQRPVIRSKWLSLALFVAVATIVRLAVRGPLLEAHPSLQYVADIATTASFANLLLALRFSEREFSVCRLALHRRLSSFSYSLYAIHMPIVFFFWAGTNHIFGKGWHTLLPTPAHWGAAGMLIATSIAAGYALSRVTEAHTDALRRLLRSMLTRLDGLTALGLEGRVGEGRAGRV
jgi:peptidoglycan/LPS O-acetylase OafA/YrhL